MKRLPHYVQDIEEQAHMELSQSRRLEVNPVTLADRSNNREAVGTHHRRVNNWIV